VPGERLWTKQGRSECANNFFTDELQRSPFLRRTETIQTNAIIAPRRVAEIGFSVNKNLRLHRLPIDQVRAGFHDDDQITAASDVESESIRSHAEAAIIRLRLRIP
jgi:hypothetical protein